MSTFLHIILYIPATMAIGAYVWEKRDTIKGALTALAAKALGKK